MAFELFSEFCNYIFCKAATLGERLRKMVRRILAFPSVCPCTGTTLNWPEFHHISIHQRHFHSSTETCDQLTYTHAGPMASYHWQLKHVTNWPHAGPHGPTPFVNWNTWPSGLYTCGPRGPTPCEPVWPSGKAGKQRDLGSNPLRLSFPFKRCGLWTLPCDFVPHNYETLKWLTSLPTLMQESF